MGEPSRAQGILKRLLEAEQQAVEIVAAADRRAEDTIAHAREQARQLIQAVSHETADSLHARVEEAQLTAAAGLKQRLEGVDAEARELERRANERFDDAVEMVVRWVTGRPA
jgi:hypothetical protein